MKRRGQGLAAALIALLSSSEAHADQTARAARQAREVASGWIVTPLDVTPSPRVLHPHEFVFRQRLLPIGYASLSGEAIDAESNKVMLPAGTGLFRLRATSGIIECAMDNQHHTVGTMLVAFGSVRVCLRDSDGDGRFEDYVHYDGLVYGLPSVNGRLPKTLLPLRQPVAYVVADPRTAPDDLFVGLRYEGRAPFSGVPRFMVAFGRGDSVSAIDQAWVRTDTGKGKLGQSGLVLLDGSILEVTASGENDATVSIRKSLPVGLFTVSQAGLNRFY